jgi:biotin carboxylase
MGRGSLSSKSNNINLVYIRAAIEAATGVKLTQEQVRQYLLEEGLISPYQYKHHATEFRGYSEYYDHAEAVRPGQEGGEIEVQDVPECLRERVRGTGVQGN